MQIFDNIKFIDIIILERKPCRTRFTRGVCVSFSVTRMRSSNSARMNMFDFTTEKIGSVHMTVFEIVAHRNVDNWIQILTRRTYAMSVLFCVNKDINNFTRKL